MATMLTTLVGAKVLLSDLFEAAGKVLHEQVCQGCVLCGKVNQPGRLCACCLLLLITATPAR